MGNFSEEYLASLEKAVAEAKEYFGGAVPRTEFSYNPTEIICKGSGYASSLSVLGA